MKPNFKLVANGDDVTALLSDRLLRLRLTDTIEERTDSLEIKLDDRDNKIKLPSTNVRLELYLGYGNALRKKGVFFGVGEGFSSPPDTLTIRASALDLKKGMIETKSRTWPKGTLLGAVVDSIAAGAGYTAVVDESLARVELGHTIQMKQTDWAFLSTLLRANGGVLKIAGGVFVAMKRGGRRSKILQSLLPELTLTRGDISQWTVDRSDRGKFGTIEAAYTDYKNATQPVISVGSGSPIKMLKTTFASESLARSHAEAEYARVQRGEFNASLTLPGKPAAMSGSAMILKDVREGIDGRYLMSSVVHELSPSGYTTRITAEYDYLK